MDERAGAVLPGDDLRIAKEFYLGKLGFKLQWEDSADGQKGIMGLERRGSSSPSTARCPATAVTCACPFE